MDNPYRRFTLLWFKYLLNPMIYINKVRDLYQRATRGYSDTDLWNFDIYLSNIIINGIRDFKKKACGYPNGLTEKRWNQILDKICTGFEANNRICEELYFEDKAEEKKLIKENNTGWSLFKKYFNHLWW